MEEKYIEILEQAVEKYGKHAQVLQTIEEMSELTKELLKNINRGKENRKEIVAETADVIIMLYQITMIYNKEDEQFDGKVFQTVKKKINRLKKRMDEIRKQVEEEE